MEVPMIAWLSLVVILAVVLGFDLLVFGRRPHEVSFKEALTWSAVYICLGVAYSFVIERWLGAQATGEYLAGFVIEKSLSVDNIFVFAVIFTALGVPAIYRQRALLWGVIGALVLRFIFILLGSTLLESFAWMIYVFGAILLVTSWRLQIGRPRSSDLCCGASLVLSFFALSSSSWAAHSWSRLPG